MSTGIQNAKIISVDTEPKVYLATEGGKRGELDHVMSASEIRGFAESASKWRAGAEIVDDEESDSQFWGSLIDCLALQPGKFDARYAVAPENYPSKGMKCPVCGSVTDAKTCRKCKADRVEVTTEKPWDWNATFCDEWKQARTGKEFLKQEQFKRAEAAMLRLWGDPHLSAFIKSSSVQVFVMAEWHDDVTDLLVPLKGLIDLVPNKASELFGKCLGDLKTARAGSPGIWPNVVFLRGYHVQASLYVDLYCAATGEDRVDFRHIVQESMPPYEPGRRFISTEFLALGRASYTATLRQYCACLKANIWPTWDDSAALIAGWSATEPRPYMVTQV